MAIDQTQRRLGPIILAPAVKPSEIVIFLIVIAIAGAMVSFTALMQPFVFTEILHIPQASQGRIGGMLAAIQQAMLLIFISFAGGLADRLGRKAMITLALVGFSISAVLFPLVTSVGALILVRALFGFAQNGHTAGAPTKMFDYPDNNSRGKFMTLVMLSLNLAGIVLVSMIGSHIPSWLAKTGVSTPNSGRFAFWMVAGVGVLAALLCFLGLKPDHRTPVAGERRGLTAYFAGFAEVFRFAAGSPAFALLLITGFVIRTDVTVLQSFLSLWVVNAGHHQGLTTLQGTKIAGALTGLQFSAFIIVPLIMGVILDQGDRVKLYIGAMAFSGVALIATTLVHSVMTWPIYGVMGVVSLAEAGQTITQQALFGQEAPAHLRGTAYGVFAFTGTFSVVIISAVSGFLFDRIGYTAPFVLAGVLHLVFLGVSLLFMRRHKHRRSATAA